jgi:uncharacterized membrane protein YedE/YeeE
VKPVIALLSGVIFAVGLGIAGMTNPAKVIGFLNFTGHWDPSLMFVMGGAVLVHLPFVQWWQRRHPPAGATARPLDRRLLVGAAIFGAGWGLSGLCPGPAFVSLAGGTTSVFIFVAALFAGSGIANRWSTRR